MEQKDLLERLLKVSKLILVTLVCITIILTIGVSKMFSVESNSGNIDNASETEYNTDYDVSMFEEIESSDIASKTKKSKQVVYIGRETCSWCAAFLPNLWQAQEDYKFKTLYIDLAKIIDFNTGDIIDQKSFDKLSKLSGNGFDGYMDENLGATPMVLIIENNEIIEAQTGYSEYDVFKTILENAGY